MLNKSPNKHPVVKTGVIVSVYRLEPAAYGALTLNGIKTLLQMSWPVSLDAEYYHNSFCCCCSSTTSLPTKLPLSLTCTPHFPAQACLPSVSTPLSAQPSIKCEHARSEALRLKEHFWFISKQLRYFSTIILTTNSILLTRRMHVVGLGAGSAKCFGKKCWLSRAWCPGNYCRPGWAPQQVTEPLAKRGEISKWLVLLLFGCTLLTEILICPLWLS